MSGNDPGAHNPTLEDEEEPQIPEELEPVGPRLFFSHNTARDFFRQFNEVLDRRERVQEAAFERRERAQDEAIRTLNANVVAQTSILERIAPLAASVDRLSELIQGLSLRLPPVPTPSASPLPDSRREFSLTPSAPPVPHLPLPLPDSRRESSPTPSVSPAPRLSLSLTDNHREPSVTPSVEHPQIRAETEQEQALRLPVLFPDRTSRRRPVQTQTSPPLSLPIRELSAAPSTIPSSGDIDNHIGRIPHLRPPYFKGRDGEDVLFWLHQLEVFFVLYHVNDKHKTFNASQCIQGEAGKFYLYLITRNDGKPLLWEEFRHAFISRYHNPMAREEILRHKLAMIKFKGTQRMAEYCEQFRHYEAQIYDMAFADRVSIFLNKLPQEAALFIRNADLASKDMEVVYRLARTWATNVRATVMPRRINAPQLIRFGKSRPKSTSPSSQSEKGKEKEKEKSSSDTEDELDVMNNNVALHLNKADMSQVTCYKCSKIGHFARDCKSTRTASSTNFSRPKPRFSRRDNKTIFYTVEDAAKYDFDEKGNELYAYDYDDDRTYSPSLSSHSDSELEEEQAGMMYLQPGTSYEHLKA